MGKLISAVQMKCPRCGEGRLYEDQGFFPMKGIFSMKRHCSNCGLKYEKEVGFFYGAMYVSYMLNIALFVTATVGYYMFFEDSLDWRLYILGYLGITFLLIRFIFRMSRSIWLMWMVSYDPDKKDIIKE
jgi:uncharacterized protein (DUF983 family)